jgi:AcrR family transcriptional regulator
VTASGIADSQGPTRGVERALAGRRRQYEDEVERLLDATFKVMRERDTANPSVADILATSGLSTSVFYRHFPTKDDLLVTLLERAHRRTHQHMEDRLAQQDDPAGRIAEWVRAIFDLLRTDELVTANRPFLLAHPRLLERFPAEIEAGFEALAAPLGRAIADARAAAGLPTAGAEADARLAMHHVFGILVDRAALGRPSDDGIVESVASYTLRAVLH